MSEEKEQAHSSYAVWLVYHFRAIEKILPALKGKTKYGWLPGFGLCIVILLVAIGFGIYMDGDVIHPPQQFLGHCPSPDTIRGGNCVFITTETTTNSSGAVTTHKLTEQAGTIENMTTTITRTVSR